MTIASTITDKPAVANGSTTQFPFPNKIFAATDLVVTLTDLVGNIYSFINFFNALTGLSYTVQNVDVDTGCTVVFSAAPTNGWAVDIRSLIPELQSTSVKNQGQFLPELHEEAFDRATRMIQDLLRLTYTYGIHGPDQETVPWSALPSAALRANLALMFNSSGLPVVGVPTTQTLTQTLLGLVLYPTLATETGVVNQWYPYNTMLRFGVDITGAADSTTKLQNCVTSAGNAFVATGAGQQVTVGWPGANLKIGAAWTYNINGVGIDWQGAFVNASAFATGNWVTFRQTNTNANQRPLLNAAHPFRNATIMGPGVANAAAVLFNIFDSDPLSGPSYWIAGLTFQSVTSWDWGQDFIFGNGAFGINVNDCQFGEDAGTATTYSVVQANASNTGEKNAFRGCFWFNKRYIINNLGGGGGEVWLENCSLDGASRAVNCVGGMVSLTDCHVEGSSDDDFWFYCTSTNGQILFKNLAVVLDAAKTNFPLMYCDASCTWGGIYGDVLKMSAPAGYLAKVLIDGTGNTKVSTYLGIGTAADQPTYISAAQDQMADTVFASGGIAADGWTASTSGSGATAPVVVATNPFYPAWSGATAYVIGNVVQSGGVAYKCIANNTNNVPPNLAFWIPEGPVSANSVQFVGAAGGFSNLISRNIPCQPGQQIFVEAQCKLDTFGAGAQFTGNISYRRADGTALSAVVGGATGAGFQFMDIAAQTTVYAPFGANASGGLGRAPPGTAYAVLSFTLGSGASTSHLGRVKVTVI